MGHYASEMCCAKCGSIRCVCPMPADLSKHKWIVDDDLSVMRVPDFDEKHRRRGLHLKWWAPDPQLKRISRPLFDTADEALAYRFVLLDDQIETAQRRIADAQLNLLLLQAKKAAMK